jgi:hypothetical protein
MPELEPEGPEREHGVRPPLTHEERERLRLEVNRRRREQLEASPDPEQLEADRRLFAEADELERARRFDEMYPPKRRRAS